MFKKIINLFIVIFKLKCKKPEDKLAYKDLYINEYKSSFMYTKLKAYKHLGYWPDFENPKSFNEKLIHRRLYSRDSIWPIITDKVAVRDWIEKQGFDETAQLIPLIDIIDNVNEFNPDDYTEPYIIKAAWAAGKNIIVKNNQVFDNKNEIDKAPISIIMKKWFREPYEVQRMIWASHEIPRRFIIEKMLLDEKDNPPKDYKFFVFHGKVELIQIHADRFLEQKKSHYDRNKNYLNISHAGKLSDKVPLPNKIDDLINVAERLGADFDFVRVDLYLHRGEIYFGELTQTPANGFGGFKPTKFDYELGKKWNYNLKYKTLG